MTTFSSIAHTHTHTLAHCPFHFKTYHTTLRARLNLRRVKRKHLKLVINLNYLPLATGFALVFFFKPLRSTPLMDLTRTRPLFSLAVGIQGLALRTLLIGSLARRSTSAAQNFRCQKKLPYGSVIGGFNKRRRSNMDESWERCSSQCLLLSTYLTNLSLEQITWNMI